MTEYALTSPGAALATARLRRGLSLSEVAKRSRVGLEYLEAIEADDWAGLPAMIYARGWIRLYAREVGISAEPLIEMLDSQLQGHAQAEVQAHTRGRRHTVGVATRRMAYAVALVLVVAGALLAVFGASPNQLEAHEPPARSLTTGDFGGPRTSTANAGPVASPTAVGATPFVGPMPSPDSEASPDSDPAL